MLVSNIGQTQGGVVAFSGTFTSLGFTTGSQSGGYTLESIEVKLNVTGDPLTDSERGTIRAELWSNTGNNPATPNMKLASLMVPSSVTSGDVTFTAPSNTSLNASTTYHVVVYTTGNLAKLRWRVTASNNEDTGGAAGWSIKDVSRFQSGNSPSGSTWNNNANVPMIRVNGAVATSTSNTNANLSALSASTHTSSTGTFTSLTLTPSTFSATTTSYTASVGNARTHLKLTPTVAATGATVKVGKQGTTLATVTSGSASAAIELSVGSNAITVEVTASDTTTKKTYTVTVTRQQALAAGQVWTATFTPANLGTLGLGCLSVSGVPAQRCANALPSRDFTVGSNSYEIVSINLLSSGGLTVLFDSGQQAAALASYRFCSGSTGHLLTGFSGNTWTVSNSGFSWTAGTPVSLSIGTSCTTQTMTQSTDATLSGLSATQAASSSGPFSALSIGTFASATTAYTATVANSITHVKLTPTVNHASATVKVGKQGTTLATVTSGSASGAIALAVGANALNVEVTAQDGTTTQTYTVTVNRAQSTDATLSGLTATSSTSASDAFTALSIGTFASGTTSYSVSVANSITHVKLTPTVNESNATVKVGKQGTTLATVTSGTASGAIELLVGANALDVEVTAQDGTTTQTYTVTVTREQAPTTQSNDAALSALTATSSTSASGSFTTLNIGTFASGTTSYSASVGNSITHVKLTPTVNNSNATVKVGKGSSLTAVNSGSASGAIALAVGANDIKAVVTAQDGTTMRTYTVRVTRASQQTEQTQSTDATLSGLTATSSTSSGGSFTTLNIGTFAAGTTSYSASVGNSITHVKLTPTVNHSNATVKVGKQGTTLATVTSGTASSAIALSVGSNALVVRVTAEDTTTTRNYTVTVTRQTTATEAESAALNLSLDGLARTLLSGAVGVIGERIAASDEPVVAMPESADADAWISATGLRLSPAATSPKTDSWRDPHAQNPDWITADLSWTRSFAFSLDAPNDSQSQTDDSQWRIWGTGDLQNFRRRQTSATSKGGWNTIYLGLERRVAGHWLGGLALASGRGKADYSYSEGAAEGRLELRLKAAYPYFSAVTAEGVEIWAMAGAGQGRATNTINGQEPHRGKLRMRMATAGLRMKMTDWRSAQLSALADAGAATLRIRGEQSLANLKSSVRRVRAGLELSGQSERWSPYMRLNVRHEGGGGLSAAGLETEAGARYSYGRLGMDVRMRWMRLTGSRKYRESGAAATLRISPAADGTGLSLTLTPSRGRPDGTDLVWRASPLPSETPAGAGNGLAMTVEVGYGIRPLQLPGLVTPTLGYARGAQGDERLRVGADYTTGLPYELRLGVGLEQRETLGDTDRNIRLDAKMHW